ncbi:MAG: TlpA family protein disulfide reductase [Flavobacteriales bacterium]|nr:TlpA family protein disulfide reductase [Flavobacteriales bacterium]
MRSESLLALFLILFSGGCAWSPAETMAPRTGPWRMELDLGNARLPFTFDLLQDGARWHMVIHNGEESIRVDDMQRRGDSLFIRMPLFDSEFIGVLEGDSVYTGHWYNYLKGPGYRIPFQARSGALPRFPPHTAPAHDPSGSWHATFSAGTPDAYEALGIFQKVDGRLSGTFGTETGDYRFLEGRVSGDSLLLSAFDGSHAFLFSARLTNDTLRGRFWSGTHWEEPWVAVREPAFRLRDPDSLTTLKEGHAMVDFSLPCINTGNLASPQDMLRKGNVVMVQVMGSWCPNCVDETILLKELYETYHDQGLEIIAVAFEKYTEEEQALQMLRRFRDRLGVPYDIVYGGEARKEVVLQQLPFLDRIMSYPTCIFVDRTGKVRRIRTGFYGPGTGEHYLNYKRHLFAFVQQLLDERGPDTLGVLP